MPAKVVLVDYDPRWPEIFRLEADRVRALLAGQALCIEHTGSTSVPGLAAKPIVDMLLIVANSADEHSYATPLQTAGYVLRIREPEWNQHRMFKGPDADINLHVFSRNCPEIDRIRSFRDWLRRNPADRDLYERTKRALAAQEWRTIDEYAAAKSVVIEEILRRAGVDRE